MNNQFEQLVSEYNNITTIVIYTGTVLGFLTIWIGYFLDKFGIREFLSPTVKYLDKPRVSFLIVYSGSLFFGFVGAVVGYFLTLSYILLTLLFGYIYFWAAIILTTIMYLLYRFIKIK